MNKKKISIVFIFIIGFMITLYPQFTKIYYNYDMTSRSLEIEKNFTKDKNKVNQYIFQKEFNEALSHNQQSISPPPVDNNNNNITTSNINKKNVVGTIKIPKLKIHYPILNEATPENLNKSVSRVSGTSYPIGGDSTNSVLAAHSYSPFNEWFTHIDKLEAGDAIIINNIKEKLIYRVTNQRIINPTQTDAIKIINGKDMITLLTCTPSGRERLLIYAERDSSDFKVNVSTKETSHYSFYEILKILSESWIIFLVSIVLLVLFIKKVLDSNQ